MEKREDKCKFEKNSNSRTCQDFCLSLRERLKKNKTMWQVTIFNDGKLITNPSHIS